MFSIKGGVMKRWDYNSLKGEIWLFLVFLSIMLVEILGVFYVFFLADAFCLVLCERIRSPESVTLLAWVSRILTVFYMYLAGWFFFWLVKKQGSI